MRRKASAPSPRRCSIAPSAAATEAQRKPAFIREKYRLLLQCSDARSDERAEADRHAADAEVLTKQAFDCVDERKRLQRQQSDLTRTYAGITEQRNSRIARVQTHLDTNRTRLAQLGRERHDTDVTHRSQGRHPRRHPNQTRTAQPILACAHQKR